ncbi:uncharacterized protein RAG0_08287 [Rhynchosporium agropyri]|uniref:Zn(2)-C6 fungal-type domain-containing protein n=1 Tax=Rhynchosporium agropyri TaxID=914238 RepID=A0A1E1KQ54_9HELO|nr:uncharacterized protein RAG0_08287 [Rhynchosporium agropyri]
MANKSLQCISRRMTEQNTVQYPLPIQAYPTDLYRRSLSPDEGRPAEKPRASKPKVRSGCVTCKARRVKCDETKPECLRCQKFGIDCDGYAPKTPQVRGLIQLQPRIPSANLYGPSVAIHSTEEEHRYFQIFANRTAHELSGFYDPTFWTKLVLQESHTIPAIRHSVIALGALNESMGSAPGPDLKVNDIQGFDKQHQEQALLAHGRAIQWLNHYISSSEAPQLRHALIACVLFVCFETFQGSYASSVHQIYGGLNILRNYYKSNPRSRPWIPRKDAIDASKFRASNVKKISNVVQTREGCGGVSKDQHTKQHVEKYLERCNHPQEEMVDEQPDYAQSFTGRSCKFPKEDTPFFIRHMGAPELAQAHRNNFYPAITPMTNGDVSHSRLSSGNPSPEASTHLIQSPASGVSNPTTPNTYTPQSTAPHTPFAVNAVSTPKSTANQAVVMKRKRTFACQSPIPVPLLQNDLIIEEVLIQSFVRLDGSNLFFGMVPGIPPLIWDTHQIWHLSIPSTPFTDFPTAQRCWDFLMDRTLQFYRRTLFNRYYAPQTSDPQALISKQYTFYLKQLSLFEKAFTPVLQDAILPDGTVLNAAALILSLYHKSTTIILAPVQNESEMVYDAYTPDFAYIVHTCQIILSSRDSTQLPRNTRFSFDTGIVPPLHVTASKCRDPTIRREAISLLFDNPRQEGMWDGVLSARIGKWLQACEEEGLPPPPSCSSSAETSPESSGKMSGFLSPARMVDDTLEAGAWQDRRKTDEVSVHGVEYGAEACGPGVERYAGTAENGTAELNGNGLPTRKKSSKKSRQKSGWFVPEENRVQLMVAHFQMAERHIKVKCQRAIPGKDGKKQERMAVIGW